MRARYRSVCSECGGAIKVGQEIAKSGGRWVHIRCASKEASSKEKDFP